MKETIEFRIPESNAKLYLNKDEGIVLDGIVRKLILPVNDKRVEKIGKIDHEYHMRGNAFYTACIITKEYNRQELDSANSLLFKINTIIEPSGEDCGTKYDESVSCSKCGINRKQNSELVLDLKHFKKHIDIAKTIAGEVIVSANFKQIWQKCGLIGAKFAHVLQRGKKAMVDGNWFQLLIESNQIDILPETQARTDFFNNEDANQYRCEGHVLGLNLFSELFVSRKNIFLNDIYTTKQAFGWKQGFLMPERPLLISQKAFDCICKAEIKGYSVEVVHVK